jgi:hypothetical protein
MELFGVGAAGAARILADVGDVTRFPDRNHFASWTGTAPWTPRARGPGSTPAVAGREQQDEPRAAHRRGRADPSRHRGPRYYRRRLAESKTPMEAVRCLKRRLSDAVYRQLVADTNADTNTNTAATTAVETGPGGHSGASSQSSAADLSTPVIGSSDQPLPGPAAPTLGPADGREDAMIHSVRIPRTTSRSS